MKPKAEAASGDPNYSNNPDRAHPMMDTRHRGRDSRTDTHACWVAARDVIFDAAAAKPVDWYTFEAKPKPKAKNFSRK